MNIMVVDSQGLLSEKQASYARNRLYYALVRFEHRINGATMHFALNDACEQVSCTLNVSVEGIGIVSVNQSSRSSDEVLNLAVSAIEHKVARHVDGRSWFNVESLPAWLVSVSQPLKLTLGGQVTPSSTKFDAIHHEQNAPNLQHSKRLSGPHFAVNATPLDSLTNS